MDVLVLCDIHGNVDALDAVLADPAAAAPDAVVVGGDAVPGPFAVETLDRLAALGVPVHRVRGNGEREVGEAATAGGSPAPDPDDMARVSAALTAAALGPGTARALGRLPLTVELDGVLYCHATPRSDEEILTRISPASRWADALAGVDAAVVVAGHTHQQDDRRVGAVRFVNAGSVGFPYEGDAVARWARVTDGVPVLHGTRYDAAAAGRRILDAGWPDDESVVAAMIEPEAAIVVTELFERMAIARAGRGA